MIVDQSLQLNSFFEDLFKKASQRLRLLERLRDTLTVHSSKVVYQAMIVPIITYCGILNLSISLTNRDRLNSFTRRAEKIIKHHSNSTIQLQDIHQLYEKRACTIVNSILRQEFDCNFEDYFELLENNTRNRGKLLKLPKVKLEVGKRSFKFMGARTFNSLPVEVRNHTSEDKYR